MKIPPNNIDTWMHRTYNNSVLVKAEHGDYLVSITPEGWYKYMPYYVQKQSRCLVMKKVMLYYQEQQLFAEYMLWLW